MSKSPARALVRLRRSLPLVVALACAYAGTPSTARAECPEHVDPRCCTLTGTESIESSRLESGLAGEELDNILVCEIPSSEPLCRFENGVLVCDGDSQLGFTASFELVDTRCFEEIPLLLRLFGIRGSEMAGTFLVCHVNDPLSPLGFVPKSFQVVDPACFNHLPDATIVAGRSEGLLLVCTVEEPSFWGTVARIDHEFPLEIVTRSCEDPEHIFQCADGAGAAVLPPDGGLFAALDDLEHRAIDGVLEQHELPLADRELVLEFARNDARALLFAYILEIAQKSAGERTAEESEIASAYSGLIKQQRIEAARIAIEEFNEWASGPCDYVAPEGFTYEPNSALCAEDPVPSLNILFDNVSPPSFEDFVAYGAAEARSAFRDPPQAAIAIETARATHSLTASGVALGAAVIAGVAIAVLITAAQGTFIFAAISLSLSAAVTAAGVAAAIAVPVVAVVLLILAGIFQTFFIVTEGAIPDQLQAALEQAQSSPAPELTLLVQTDGGKQDLFLAFIQSTLPDFNGFAVPTRDPGDPVFRVTDEEGDNPSFRGTIDLIGWADQLEPPPCCDGRRPWTHDLRGGWFASRTVLGAEETADGVEKTVEFLSLHIQYVGWDLVDWTARRIGDTFVHLRSGGDPGNDCREAELGPDCDVYSSDAIRYIDGDLVPRSATIFHDTSAPVITPIVSGDLGGNGWYVSDVSLSWEVSDPETAISSQSGCGNLEISTDGTHGESCSATSGGGARTETITIKRDATAPTIAGTTLGPPNEQGWHKQDLIVQFECADFEISGRDFSAAGSGCGPNPAIFTETAHREVVGTATDMAGNTSMDTVIVKLDKTPPTIGLSTEPPPNEAGWHQEDFTVIITCTDALSGIAAGGCTPNRQVTAETPIPLVIPARATDDAGNETPGTITVRLDETQPLVTLTTPAAGAQYVQHQVVPADWSAADALSGLASSHGTVASGQPLATASVGGHSFTVTAADLAGNVAEVTHGYIVLSAADASANLIEAVQDLDLQHGIETSLVRKLAGAIERLADGNTPEAAKNIRSFINQVNALRGRKIDPAQADALVDAALLILGALP